MLRNLKESGRLVIASDIAELEAAVSSLFLIRVCKKNMTYVIDDFSGSWCTIQTFAVIPSIIIPLPGTNAHAS